MPNFKINKDVQQKKQRLGNEFCISSQPLRLFMKGAGTTDSIFKIRQMIKK